MRRLTDNMRHNWVEKGYLLLKGVLTRDQVAGYLSATDEVSRQIPRDPSRGPRAGRPQHRPDSRAVPEFRFAD